MKTIGLLGGMSWESTVSYYQLINKGIKEKLGGLHSAKIVLYSVDFEEIERLQQSDDWQAAAVVLSEAAKNIERGGADFLLICTNTMHKVAPEIEQSITIPLLHIADATGETIIASGHKTVGLLGTAFTMEQDFYKRRLQDKFGLTVIVPEKEDRNTIHDIIYNELCLGRIKDSSKEKAIQIINRLTPKGAEAIILGCTEIPLLVQQEDSSVPLFDTTLIHAQKAVDYSI